MVALNFSARFNIAEPFLKALHFLLFSWFTMYDIHAVNDKCELLVRARGDTLAPTRL